MKLTYFQFDTHIAKSLSSIYIISGDEVILKQDVIQQIRKKAKSQGFDERVRLTAEAGYDWGQLHLQLNSPSLLAEKRLIELDCRESTPPKIASQILQEYAERPSSDNILLIDISKIDDKIAKSAWYKALEKAGIVVTIWPMTHEQFPEWILKRAQKYKLRISPAAAKLLADYVEGNLVAAAQAVEKIYLLKANEDITPELIHTIFIDESHYTVFDLVEQFIAGDNERCLHILEVLKEEGTEPTLIIWAISRELRMLIEMGQQLADGSRYDDLWQKHRIFSRRQPILKRFLANTPPSTSLTLLAATGNIDQMVKGALPGNPWHALQLLCFRNAR